jgi:hypothetical protein
MAFVGRLAFAYGRDKKVSATSAGINLIGPHGTWALWLE